MVTAYILIKSHTVDADQIRTQIGDLEGVTEVHIVAGDVDFIAKVDVESAAEVKTIAADGIHAIDGVETTQTYIAMD